MSKKNMILMLQTLTICSLLHISTITTSSRGSQRSSSRTTRTSSISQSDIRQVESLLNMLKKDPKNTTWRNEATKKIQDIKRINPDFGGRYQKQYDSIIRNIAVESKAQFIKRQLDTEVMMLKKKPTDPIWQRRIQENINMLKNEDVILANNYQAQLDMIVGKTVQSTPTLPKKQATPYYGKTTTQMPFNAQQSELKTQIIKNLNTELMMLKRNPSSAMWRRKATESINVLKNEDVSMATDYQKQYDMIVGQTALESKAQFIKKQLDTELMMLKRTPTNTMWQRKIKENIDALRNEDSDLADNYQAQFDAIMQ